MKIYSILSVILVTLCFFACKSNKENEYQPLTIENYAEVSLGDTTNLIITGGSGNIIVEGNDKVDIATAQNDKHKITLIGKEIGTTNIFVRDKITNESCSIEVNVIFPFLTLNFEKEEGNHLNIGKRRTVSKPIHMGHAMILPRNQIPPRHRRQKRYGKQHQPAAAGQQESARGGQYAEEEEQDVFSILAHGIQRYDYFS